MQTNGQTRGKDVHFVQMKIAALGECGALDLTGNPSPLGTKPAKIFHLRCFQRPQNNEFFNSVDSTDLAVLDRAFKI